jgi:GNAT acetyltransferase-like protein
VKANLVADGGTSGSDAAQFFRSPEFLAAEAVTHTVSIGTGEGELRLPLIVRSIEGTDRLDATSPYGYPGGDRMPATPVDPSEIDWSGTGLVSIFVRDRIAEGPCFEGGTVRNEVHLASGRDGIRKRLREQIRRNERRGWRVVATSGPDVAPGQREAFEAAYSETMGRTEAAERYLYPSEYFEAVFASGRSWLLLAGLEEGEPAAGAIAVASDEHLHYYLGGTIDAALDDSPMKNLFAAMIDLAGELGLSLNLGGGIRPGDSLDSFKRGFATATAPFRTHEVVCDGDAYEELSARAAKATEGFFPAYRA